jgi:hypothetical protein
MTFGVYTGELARNASVNITRHGTFEADSVTEALKRIKFNVDNRYCNYGDRSMFDENMNWALQFGMFVCQGEPLVRNLVWRDKKAVVSWGDARRPALKKATEG